MTTLLSIRDAAVALDVHPRTIRRAIAAGRIEAVRLGPRLIRVTADSLASYQQPVA